MKKKIVLIGFSFIFFIIINAQNANTQDPWKREQLISPKSLSDLIKAGKKVPTIINIGPDASIKNAINVGPVNYGDGMNKLKSTVSKIKKTSDIVIYCGCCTYFNCPNIRPAFSELTRFGYKKVKVLEIPENLRVDWVEKGYPMSK